MAALPLKTACVNFPITATVSIDFDPIFIFQINFHKDVATFFERQWYIFYAMEWPGVVIFMIQSSL